MATCDSPLNNNFKDVADDGGILIGTSDVLGIKCVATTLIVEIRTETVASAKCAGIAERSQLGIILTYCNMKQGLTDGTLKQSSY